MADETLKPNKELAPRPEKEIEVVKATFIEVFGERFKSYTLGGFVLAWIAVHWKAVFATVFIPMDALPGYDADNQPILNKIDYFKSLKYDYCDHYIWPLLIALAVPLVAAFFDEIVINVVKQLITKVGRGARKRLATERLYSSEEHREVERERDVAKSRYDAERKSREAAEDDVGSLRDRIKQEREEHRQNFARLENELDEVKKQLVTTRDSVSNLQSEVVRLTKDNTEVHADRENLRLKFAQQNEKLNVAEQELKSRDEQMARYEALDSAVQGVRMLRKTLELSNQAKPSDAMNVALAFLSQLEQIHRYDPKETAEDRRRAKWFIHAIQGERLLFVRRPEEMESLIPGYELSITRQRLIEELSGNESTAFVISREYSSGPFLVGHKIHVVTGINGPVLRTDVPQGAVDALVDPSYSRDYLEDLSPEGHLDM